MAIEGYSKSIRDLIMGDNLLFHIPIYQRSYTWVGKQQVKKLLDDIFEFAHEHQTNHKAEYYIGNVILKNQHRGFVTERIVIDGQQRITTTILMLCVLRDLYLQHSQDKDDLQSAQAIAKSLYESDGVSFRIKLNNMEHQKTLNLLLSGALEKIGAEDRKTLYWKNYQHIRDYLERLRSKGDWRFKRFSEILNRVKVVAIFLSEDQDENAVFESINSAGMPLSGPDLIKNFIFTFKHYDVSHNQERQLVDLYTRKFEDLFSSYLKPSDEIEAFFREYIAVKTGEKVKKDPKVIYYAYKNWVGAIENLEHCRRLILDLEKWGVIYNTLHIGSHPDLNSNNLGYLRDSFYTYATLLMDMVDKLGHVEDGRLRIIDKNQLNAALARVVVYDVSRFLAGAGLKTITRFIPKLPKTLEAANPNYFHDYANALTQHLANAQKDYRQPSATAIRTSVNALDRSTNRKQLLHFLVLLENIERSHPISFEGGLKGCELVHIIPQTLGIAWQDISQQDHEEYLHKLGNLTITFDNNTHNLAGLNFVVKKLSLMQNSKVQLNSMLAEYNSFGPEQVRDRAARLLDMFFEAYDARDSIPWSEPPMEETKEKLTPQQWLYKVRSQIDPKELEHFKKASTWKAICDHLNIDVGQDSAHRRLEKWRSQNRSEWPDTGIL